MPISYIELTLLLACTSRLRLAKQNSDDMHVSLPGRPLPPVSGMSNPPSGTFVQPLALATTMPGSCVVPTATFTSRLTVSSSGFRVNLGMPRFRVFSAPPMAGGFDGFTIWLVPFRPLCLHDVGAAPPSCARRSSRKSEINMPPMHMCSLAQLGGSNVLIGAGPWVGGSVLATAAWHVAQQALSAPPLD